MAGLSRTFLSLVTSLLVLLLASIGLSKFPAWRLDLTSEKIYTLSAGTRQLVAAIDEPLQLQFYFSGSAAQNLPQLQEYGHRIRDLLREYVALDPSHLSLEIVDPQPFSEAEEQAVANGLQAAPLMAGGDSLYLGLIGENAAGTRQTIEFFSPQREEFLEYDISQLLYQLGQPRDKTVAVLSSVQMFGGFDFASGRPQSAWAVIETLRDGNDVRELHLPLQVIDEDVGVLLLANPQDLDDESLYAIDQFALRGGKLLIFADPRLEIIAGSAAEKPALGRLFDAWGLDVNPQQVTVDRQRALRVGGGPSATPMPHVGILGLVREDLNADDILTAELENVNLAGAGSLSLAEGSKLKMTPLMQTSRDSMLIDLQHYTAVDEPGELLRQFKPDDKRHVLAARISGEVQSAFTAPPATDSDTADTESSAMESGAKKSGAKESEATQPAVTEAHARRAQHLQTGHINAVVVADLDLLADRLWVQVSNFFGQSVVVPWAGNGDFVVNAVENLAGSDALIGLRSRGRYSRPFERVNTLRARAAEQFKREEQVLLQRLDALEQSIASLAPQMDAQGQAILSPEQEAEIASFEAQRLDTRKQLRLVQRELNRSIEELETRLKWLNMGVIPTLLLVIMFVVYWRRRQRAGM